MDWQKEEIYEAFRQNKGYMTYQQFKKLSLSYKKLLEMIAADDIKVKNRGLYHLSDVYLDEYFVLQNRFSKGIYSLEMALWLHGLSITVPFEPIMTFPYGTNSKNIKAAGIRPIMSRSHYNEGIIEIERLEGQFIRVYDAERTLVECLKSIYNVDIQIIAPAFKSYFQKNSIQYSKLFNYASLFKVEDKLQSYLEVLS